MNSELNAAEPVHPLSFRVHRSSQSFRAHRFMNTTSHSPLRVLALALALALFAPAAPAAETGAVVSVGPGGYLTERPKPCKPLPERIYRTARLTGPVPTHQWWTSLLWLPYSQPLYAHPLALTCTAKGLNISYPGANLHANKSAIFAFVTPKDADIELGHSASSAFSQADCDGFSDWFVTAAFTAGDKTLRASFGHGSPFVYCRYEGGEPMLTFRTPPQVWAGSQNDPVLGLSIAGRHYGLFGAAGSTWTGLGTATLTNHSGGKPYFSLALLPDNTPETLALFRKYAYNHVTDTRVDYAFQAPGVIRAIYRFTIKSYEGGQDGTLFALYPHQWKYAATELTDKTYASVRGPMKLGAGLSFTTEVPVQGVLPMLPGQGIPDKARLRGYLQAEADKKPRNFGDTYWEGKLLGRLATLSGIAEAAGETQLQQQFVDEIKRRLENWFTAAPGKDQPVFYYNAAWGTLIGSRPSFGSDDTLNDHHFHYGYFVRAAAEVARVDPAWARRWRPMVKLLIREIASPDRDDPLFPFMRCFDRYAGHSWASGNANFVDGNNQESSSESMNAWYGLILWGQATGDLAVRDLGLFLFNTERTAIEEYWFDVSSTNFPKDFPNVALGMVWGGKGAFGTWFSGEIDCIHGINWLPFTPASIYMGRFPDYVRKNHDRMIQQRKGGKDYNTGWGDLLAMFHALDDPADAARYIDANPNCKVESGNSHAFMYHWIHTLNALGRNDPSVTADHPLVNIYVKNGLKTYVVYADSDKPKTVNFSDGARVESRSKGLTVQRGNP